MLRHVAIAITCCCFAACSAGAQTLQVQTLSGPGAIVGENFVLPLQATGGTQPYLWNLASGNLPPGFRLHPHAGNVSGVPTSAGDYHFTLSVADSSIPPLQAQREFTVHVIAGLTIEWNQAPAVQGNAISGSAVVSNQTPDEFTLTFVVVAVNEIGRATTLGYQHLRLSAQSSTEVIPFGASPGLGTYYVRADAIAHHPKHHRVFRASKQSEPLKVTQF